MLQINFQHIRPYGSGITDAFEELCCQIFHRLSNIFIPNFQVPQGSQFQRFRGAGGDGGVEALWILPNGDKWGLQAKYFDKLENSQLHQMQKSLQTAVNNHPELTQYIFCISSNLTGRTGRGQGEIDKLEKWKQKRLQDLASHNINLSIEFWTESILRDYLLAVDQGGGLRRYWFDHEILTNDWLQKRLNDAKAQAGKRYSPKLSVKVPAFNALEAFTHQDNTWKDEINAYVKEFNEIIRQWHIYVNNVDDLPKNSHQIVQNITEQITSLKSLLNKYIHLGSPTDVQIVRLEVSNLIENTRAVEAIFHHAFLEEHGQHADTPQFRQFHAEYQCDFPAAKLDTSRELLKCLQTIAQWVNSQDFLLPLLPKSQFMLLRGCAGVGKTHAIVDHALHSSKTEQLCLVFYGEDFTGDEPWKIIADKLGLPSTISRDELWGMIDSAAETTGKPAVIYIDALNESPEMRRWKTSWLAPLCQQITHFPRLKLCVSCRDTYLDEVFNDRREWVEFEHNGFFGNEFKAIKQFFEYYEVEPPTTPLLQLEYTNPLFLHLLCQTLQELTPRSLPLGTLGFTDVLRLLLEEKNKRIAEVCRYDTRDDKVTKAVNALAKKMAEEKTRFLSREAAQDIVHQIFSVDDSERSLFIQLEKEGLIALVEERSRPLAPRQWFCRFTFERVADFLIAWFLLEGIQSEQLSDVVSHFTNETFTENQGLLEAFSIILPENLQVELTDVIHHIDRYKILLPIISSGFQWRSIDTFSKKTKKLVNEGLANATCCPAILDALFGIAVIPNHPLNAEFIDELLNQQDLTTRDPFWCGLLHEDFEKQGGAWRLIEWSLNADLSSFSEETSCLWALLLSWCCAASDRRVRDRATKGLTRLFISHPSTIKTTLLRFIETDDDYVLERVALAAYSALLLLQDNNVLQVIAHTIYTEVFDRGEIPENALIRDWLRLIIELAYSRHLLTSTSNINTCRPPYHSQPLHISSEEEIAHLVEQDAFKRNMNLDEFPGGFGETDFAKYVLRPKVLRHYDLNAVGINQKHIHRWFIKSVSELGYPGFNSQCYEYDRYLLGKYGGGRGRPTWAERLGKKYYWILLARLAGILADHVTRKTDSQEKDTSLPRLQGIDLRTIDPTDLRAFSSKQEIDAKWYQPVDYNFDITLESSHEEWIELPDFPALEQIVQIADNEGKQWLHLFLDSSLKKVMSSAQYPYRNLRTITRTAFVASADIENIKEQLSTVPLFATLDTPHDYRLLIAEYPNTLPCTQRFETGEILLKDELPGTESAQFTTISLLKGNEWEYDCAQDEYVPSLTVPMPELLNFRNLMWDGQSSWLDESQTIQVTEISTESNSGVLIRREYLENFLQAYSLALVFIGYQEKLLINEHSRSPKIHELRTAYIFDGQNIINVYNFSEIS
jgi:hypothetical protein